MSTNIIMVTCVHKREQTVQSCFNKMPFIKKVVVYSLTKDNQRHRKDVLLECKYENAPLSFKWEKAISILKNIDFTHVIIMGSDDYVDEKTFQFIRENCLDYDVMGFTDLFIEQGGGLYYWPGYKNERHLEPIGAGRVYSRSFLEKLGFSLYRIAASSGLDRMAWGVVKANTTNIGIFSLRDKGLFLCDVKDSGGITQLRLIPDIEVIRKADKARNIRELKELRKLSKRK